MNECGGHIFVSITSWSIPSSVFTLWPTKKLTSETKKSMLRLRLRSVRWWGRFRGGRGRSSCGSTQVLIQLFENFAITSFIHIQRHELTLQCIDAVLRLYDLLGQTVCGWESFQNEDYATWDIVQWESAVNGPFTLSVSHTWVMDYATRDIVQWEEETPTYLTICTHNWNVFTSYYFCV